MKKGLRLIITFTFLFIIIFWATTRASTALAHSQEVVIVKYGLNSDSTTFEGNQTNNSGFKINNIVVDNFGEQLKLLSNISYQIKKVTPSGVGSIQASNSATYQIIGNPINIITNNQGVARINLSDGSYILSEQANASEGLLKPALPILLDLPTSDRLNEVYIYPKSSIVRAEGEPSMTKQQPKQIMVGQNLPRTGDFISWGVIITGAIFLVIGIFISRNKEKKM